MDSLGSGSRVPALLSAVLRSLSPSHFSGGKDLRTPHLPQLSRCPNPQRPGLTTCHPGTEYFIGVQFLSAPRRKREGEIEKGTRTRPQTPPPTGAQGICPVGPRKTS